MQRFLFLIFFSSFPRCNTQKYKIKIYTKGFSTHFFFTVPFYLPSTSSPPITFVVVCLFESQNKYRAQNAYDDCLCLCLYVYLCVYVCACMSFTHHRFLLFCHSIYPIRRSIFINVLPQKLYISIFHTKNRAQNGME